ncbi:MAG TPA: hypothetical protein VKV28_09595 [Candidatus Binataceae bacterium]|nr:hypothetical protein [Candidatus Binataceae bacterium]
MARHEEPSPEKVDPRGVAPEAPQAFAAKNFAGIEESQEVARHWAQKFLFYLIAGCLVFLALFDASLLLPSVHVETKVIITVNGAFAGGSGLLGLCASYILAPYKTPRARRTSRKTTN